MSDDLTQLMNQPIEPGPQTALGSPRRAGRPGEGMRLADDLFLIALDDRTGRFRLEPALLSLGLAGALLAELLLSGAVALGEDDRLHVRPRTAPPDALGHAITELITAEPQHELPTWLRYLATDAVDKVADRLARAKVIRVEQARSLLRSTTLYQPVEGTAVAWRPVRLTVLIDKQQIEDWPDCVLACLAHAVGLTRFVLRDSDNASHRYLDQLHGELHRAPALATVVAVVASAAGAQVITHHR